MQKSSRNFLWRQLAVDSLIRLIAQQGWIRYGIRDKIIRGYCDPDRVGPHDFEVDYFGFRYKGNLNSFLDWSVYFYGAYEKEYLFFLKDLIKDTTAPVFVDVGANVGCHSLFMSKYCKEVHSFEPNPEVRSKLEEKIRTNSVTNVYVHGVGLGQKHEDLPFFSPKGANQGTGSFIAEHSENNLAGPVLKVVAADEYIASLKLNKVDLIKIDVEGFEKHVLIGLRETMCKYRPKLTVEYSRTTMKSLSNLRELMDILPPGYQVKRIVCNRSQMLLFNSQQCRLVDFDFAVPGGDLLISPA
jgi:FkbM family methyltransferase